MEYIPFPSRTDDNFEQIIASKEEFAKYAAKKDDSPEDEQYNRLCSPLFFDLQPVQKIVANFMSPATTTKSLLLYWEPGVGKCVSGETLVTIRRSYGQISMKLDSLWEKTYTGLYGDETGEWKTTDDEILALDESGKPHYTLVENIFRQHVNTQIRIVTTATKTLTSLNTHRLAVYYQESLSSPYSTTWTSDLCVGDNILTISCDHKLQMEPIISITTQQFSGFVYDVSVPSVNNYIANGFVTHNTCGSIRIVDQFKHFTKKNNSTIFLITPPTLMVNMYNTIYSFEKERLEEQFLLDPGVLQCTDYQYYIPPKHNETPQQRKNRHKAIKLKINSFYGGESAEQLTGPLKVFTPGKFVNFVNSLEDKSIFTNAVFVIDEAHKINSADEEGTDNNIKLYNTLVGDGDKPGILGNNSRIVLLTATPMEDKKEQLLFITNVLRYNNNESKLTENDLFPGGRIHADVIKDALRGYISYVKANEITFPKVRVLINSYIPSAPISYIQGVNTKNYQNNLMGCVLGEQQSIVLHLAAQEHSHRGGIGQMIDERMGANIVFPRHTEIANVRQLIGKSGFALAYSNTISNGYLTHANKTGINFLQPPELDTYSTKLSAMYQILFELPTIGKHYMYSEFIECGVVIMALFLESNGFARAAVVESPSGLVFREHNTHSGDYPGANILDTPHRIEPRCGLCMKLKSVHLMDTSHQFKQATYMMYIGTPIYNTPNQREALLATFNSLDNVCGQKIKVMIGSKITGTGLDLKSVTNVHIFDPWWNQTRMYQAINRAARHCGHKDLRTIKSCGGQAITPETYSTVYLHNYSTTRVLPDPPPSDKEELEMYSTETIDEYIYGTAYAKDAEIQQVLHILQEIPIDCELNKEINNTDPTNPINCRPNVVVDGSDKSTLLDHVDIEIMSCVKYIKAAFKTHIAMELKQLERYIENRFKVIPARIILLNALDTIIGSYPFKQPMVISNGTEFGTLISVGNKDSNYIVFQPNALTDIALPLETRVITRYRRTTHVKLSDMELPVYTEPIDFNPRELSDADPYAMMCKFDMLRLDKKMVAIRSLFTTARDSELYAAIVAYSVNYNNYFDFEDSIIFRFRIIEANKSLGYKYLHLSKSNPNKATDQISFDQHRRIAESGYVIRPFSNIVGKTENLKSGMTFKALAGIGDCACTTSGNKVYNYAEMTQVPPVDPMTGTRYTKKTLCNAIMVRLRTWDCQDPSRMWYQETIHNELMN
jgi:hypothetical protein